jgi:hypothetical protein
VLPRSKILIFSPETQFLVRAIGVARERYAFRNLMTAVSLLPAGSSRGSMLALLTNQTFY